ncbi:ABC transporter D family member 2, chloroplastic isoform X1 [Sorghum bicolor]|uniref:ABC transporter D family member 2, chloroplastic isoform X1 n=1 Tax=Sorghum bicolor TaxID=4558 RepID=UPI000B425CC3|nr:ABC transporter D family member 2, chloroplastic isoform X1 [Sorghum bicolor]|eukprot:XP_021311723.1 ABC transporter D family member 2, chloroplastic isoform X1 [Sorghum bicolor]
MRLSTPIPRRFPSTTALPPQLPPPLLLPRPSYRLAAVLAPGSAARRGGLPPPPPSVASAMRRCSRRRRAAPPPAAAAGGGGEVAAPDSQVKRAGTDLKTLATRFWKVAAPYWWSEDKTQARLRLAAVFALTLGTTGISVGFNFLGRDFYNALADKDQEKFTTQLLYYLGAFAGGIPFFVLRDYARETLSLRWRSWMTSYYMKRYFKNRTFYKIQSQSIIDNPDQRINDDLSAFTGTALAFSLTLFNAAVDLVSFSNILYGIYPPLFIVLVVYSLGGTAISVFLGKNLVNLNFMQEKKEADFRYGLVRVRENAESIAFYGGEENELQLLLDRFRRAFENLSELLIASRNLEFFTNGYRYLIQILPAAVVAPMYFSGKIEFGVINQSVSAFNHILSDFSLIVFQFQSISAFSAVIDRLGEFDDLLDGNEPSVSSQRDSIDGINIVFKSSGPSVLSSNGSLTQSDPCMVLEIRNLTLLTPRSGNVLITGLTMELKEKDHLLVMGPSGSGKTSLLRALAGLWTSGTGEIIYHVRGSMRLQKTNSSSDEPSNMNLEGEELLQSSKQRRDNGIFFVPQRPYMVLGTLRQQLLYPTWTEEVHHSPDNDAQNSADRLPFLSEVFPSDGVSAKSEVPTTAELIEVLEVVKLGYILPRFNGLDSMHDWASVLSLGEQQRLAFARLLLATPTLVLLDESTSALDEANEAHLYSQIEAAGITYVSIGHRKTLHKFHNKALYISKSDSTDTNLRSWELKPTDQLPLEESSPFPS